MRIQVMDNVSKNLKRMAKSMENSNELSVEDASRYCSLVWKSRMPHKTNTSRQAIHYYINKEKDKVIGYVISPTNTRPNSFYLNLFLEGVYDGTPTPGATSRIVKDKPYNLKHGYFGAGFLASEQTRNFFNGVIRERVRGLVV